MELTLFLFAFLAGTCLASKCSTSKKTAAGDSIYCICNKEYCDEVPYVEQTESDKNEIFTMISSSQSGLRFHVVNGTFTSKPAKKVEKFNIIKTKSFQTIMGFGGTLTDAAALQINSLSDEMKQKLLSAYFGNGSIEYNMVRVPMGSNEFSTAAYSYAEVENDKSLKNFALANTDKELKIPFLKEINSMSNQEMRYITTPWSPSPWMKTINSWIEGELRPEYFQTWADYFVKFLKAYEEKGIEFWALTPQNEPLITFKEVTMSWKEENYREWINKFLIPSLTNAGLKDINILIGDSKKIEKSWVKNVLRDKNVKKSVSGIAFHWNYTSTGLLHMLNSIHEKFPDKFLLFTQPSTKFKTTQKQMGSWEVAEKYAGTMIDVLSTWATGWIDENMALNKEGGPNWFESNSDSPIIVNEQGDEFYKQPLYYVIGHFSKYVPPESKRIRIKKHHNSFVKTVAFKRPDDSIVVILQNTKKSEMQVNLQVSKMQYALLSLPPNSINTFVC